jgi:hypothetical protein
LIIDLKRCACLLRGAPVIRFAYVALMSCRNCVLIPAENSSSLPSFRCSQSFRIGENGDCPLSSAGTRTTCDSTSAGTGM